MFKHPRDWWDGMDATKIQAFSGTMMDAPEGNIQPSMNVEGRSCGWQFFMNAPEAMSDMES